MVHHIGKTQTSSVYFHAIRRFLAFAFDINAKNAAACFHFLIPMALRQFDDLGHFRAVIAFRNIVDQLFENLHRLLDFFQTRQIAAERVAIFKHHLFEIEFPVNGIRVRLTQIARPTGSTSGRSGHAIAYGIFLAQHAHLFQTVLEYDVARDKLMVFFS